VVGEALQRKLVVAIAECDEQIKVFTEVNKTVDANVRNEWKRMINNWLKDQLQPNPYSLNRKGKFWSY
jgi:hypothetical protein